jgi:hypothetical protein
VKAFTDNYEEFFCSKNAQLSIAKPYIPLAFVGAEDPSNSG